MVDEVGSDEESWESRFREQMAYLRAVKNMTQTDLAKAAKDRGLAFHQQTVQRIEQGERPVRLNEAYIIASILGSRVAEMAAAQTGDTRATKAALLKLQNDTFDAAEVVQRTLEKWSWTPAAFARQVLDTIWDHTRAQNATYAELPPPTLWALAWAMKAERAYRVLNDGVELLVKLTGDDYDIAPGFGPEDYEVLDHIRDLRAHYPEAVQLSELSADELATQIPTDRTGQ